MIAATFVAMEDGFQMEVLAGRMSFKVINNDFLLKDED